MPTAPSTIRVRAPANTAAGPPLIGQIASAEHGDVAHRRQGFKCIGGAVDLISAVDIRYASADAKISVREVKLAIVAVNAKNRRHTITRLFRV